MGLDVKMNDLSKWLFSLSLLAIRVGVSGFMPSLCVYVFGSSSGGGDICRAIMPIMNVCMTLVGMGILMTCLLAVLRSIMGDE